MKRTLILGSLISVYLVSTTSFAANINNSATRNISDQSMNLQLAAVPGNAPGSAAGKQKRSTRGYTVPQRIQEIQQN